MSANSLSVPFPIFNDIDGDPLDAGYIYIGTANLDPETNPISVYFDAALTIPATQPIRTLNGFPSNSGSPSRLYVNANDYSITVKNKNGSQVYTSAVSTERVPVSIITGQLPASQSDFLQAGTGATTRTAQNKMRDSVSVKDFGATGDGATDDTAAIKAALAAHSDIYFPSGTYIVSETIRASSVVHIDGDKDVTIRATTPFTGVSVTDGGVPTTLDAIFAIFAGTTINDIAGTRIGANDEASSFIGKMNLDCNHNCDYGVFWERAPYTRCEANVFGADNTGVWVGVYSWGSVVDGSKIIDCTTNGVFCGNASNGVLLDGISVWGNPTRTVNGVNCDTYCNGLVINGGFIERCEVGVLGGIRNGPIELIGIDFEAHSQHCVKMVHDGSEGRKSGPVIIDSCYLDSTEENVYGVYYNIAVHDCRMRAPALTSGSHYYGDANTSFDLENNIYDSGGVTIAENISGALAVSSRTVTHSSETTNVRKRKTSVAYEGGWNQYNYFSTNQPQIVSSSMRWLNSNQGGASDLHTGKWELTVNSTLTSGGVPGIYYTGGVEFHSIGSTLQFVPKADNTHKLGAASQRWSEVFAGTGTINTSDEREKTTLLEIDDIEKACALELKQNIKKFKFNDSVERKGDDARIHFGVGAQTVKAIFEKHGLNAESYALFCYDEWDAEPEIIGEDEYGNSVVLQEAKDAGSLYGVRYEELLAFIISAI